jgi:hypothetical protein
MCPRANDADTRPNRTGEDDRGRRSGLATRLRAHSSQLAEADSHRSLQSGDVDAEVALGAGGWAQR